MTASAPKRSTPAAAAGSKPTSSATPTKPSSTPATRPTVSGSSRRKIAPIGITKIGTAALSTDVNVESTCISAQVMSVNGSAMLMAPITKRWP